MSGVCQIQKEANCRPFDVADSSWVHDNIRLLIGFGSKKKCERSNDCLNYGKECVSGLTSR